MSKRTSTPRRGHREKSRAAEPSLPVSTPAPRPAPPWLEAATRHGFWIVLAAAALTHLVHCLLLRANDPFYAQTLKGFDMYTYWTWGQKIADGDILSREYTNKGPFYYGPLYPYYLALVFKVFGQSFDVVHGLQALWGIFPPVLLFLIVRRLFGGGAALAAGLLAAFCAPMLFYEQLLLMEGILLLIHAAVLWLLVRGQRGGRGVWGWALAAGVLSAVACWGRGNFLLAMPFLAAAWVVVPFALGWMPSRLALSGEDENREDAGAEEKAVSGKGPKPADQAAATRRFRLRSGATCAAAFSLGAGLFLAVPLARNLAVSHQFVLTTSNGPINLYIGNAHDSFGVFAYPESYNQLVKQHAYQDAVPWKKELRRDIFAHPMGYLKVVLRKAWIFWNSYDVGDNANYYIAKRFSWLLRWSPVTWLLVVPLAVLGLWHTRRDWRSQLFLYVYAAGFSLSIIAVFISGRFRVEECLPLLIWSGAAVAAVGRQVREGRWNAVAIQALIVAAGIGILWPSHSPAARLNVPDSLPDIMKTTVPLIRANDYSMVAIAYSKLDRKEEGKAVLEEATRVYPWYDEVVSRLASYYTEEGRADQAIPLLQGYTNTMGGHTTILLQLAQAQMIVNRPDEARANLEAVLRADPNNAQARALLARIPKTR